MIDDAVMLPPEGVNANGRASKGNWAVWTMFNGKWSLREDENRVRSHRLKSEAELAGAQLRVAENRPANGPRAVKISQVNILPSGPMCPVRSLGLEGGR